MGIVSTSTDVHWNYLLALEEDLGRLARFIEFDKKNEKCFSLENARLLMAAAAETDIVCKQICEQVKPNSKARSLGDYYKPIITAYPAFKTFKVEMPRYGQTLTPWADWTPKKGPLWWQAYNNVKHHRHTHYSEANLKNVLNAVAGLFVACLYLYKDKARMGELVPWANILSPTDANRGELFFGTGGMSYAVGGF